MKKLLSKNRMGTQLAYAKFTQFFFKHNQKRGNCDSIYSLSAKTHEKSFKGTDGNTPIASITEKVFFGIKPKESNHETVPGDFDRATTKQKSSPQYTLDMLTPVALDVISEKIGVTLEKEGTAQPDHTYSLDKATANNAYFSILLYSLSIFKIINVLLER